MRPPIICDTSGLLAAADTADPDHEAAATVISDSRGPLVVSPLVVAELDYLLRLRLSPQAARAFSDDVAARAYEIAPFTSSDMAACVDLDRRYADLGIGITDAHNVVLASRYDTDVILTLDQRHFRPVRALNGRTPLRLLPADA